LLKYYGDSRKAELYTHVRLIKGNTTLTTDRLDYDMNTDVASYNSGARIIDRSESIGISPESKSGKKAGAAKSTENVLTSRTGYFYSRDNMLFFRKDVVLTNPDYVLLSDTLKYSTTSNTAFFYGPTTVTGQSSFIYAESGWYDTGRDVADLNKNSFVRSGAQKIWGETIHYERPLGTARAMGDIVMHDTVQNVYITGMYGYSDQQKDSALVTGKALMVQVLDDDTLFLHGDTLAIMRDSLSKAMGLTGDSAKKVLMAYHHVKMYKFDLQGKCDSLVYMLRDSMIHMFREPVLWSDVNQLTATHIRMQLANDRMDKLYLDNGAFIVSQEDTARYSQIKGRDMIGYFEQNELRRIHVEGNAQTIYFARDKVNKYIGVNRAEGSEIMIGMADSKVQKINIIKSPEATFYPVNELSAKELRLKDFIWRSSERPMQKGDIYNP
jgi:lipopolysaccharide export system protein LptA